MSRGKRLKCEICGKEYLISLSAYVFHQTRPNDPLNSHHILKFCDNCIVKKDEKRKAAEQRRPDVWGSKLGNFIADRIGTIILVLVVICFLLNYSISFFLS